MNIKECFTSRFGCGYVIDADFKQLECVALACLTEDPVLLSDLREGRDMHCMSAAFLSGESYETIYTKYEAGDPKYAALRKTAKGPSFQLQYGSGATSMAAKCGLKVEQCKAFIENYYNRYQGVKAWQDRTLQIVKESRVPTDKRSSNGYPLGMATITSCTGRRYCFMEQESPPFMQRKGIMTSFKPTEPKNYPVQGFATGDIVPHMLGVLYRELLSSELYGKLLLVNTVHDSIVFDCEKDVLDEACGFIDSVLGTTKDRIEEHFRISLPIGFKYSIEYGTNWFEMEEWK